jgi:hypothetical protein
VYALLLELRVDWGHPNHDPIIMMSWMLRLDDAVSQCVSDIDCGEDLLLGPSLTSAA